MGSAAALLNAMPDATSVLNRDGTIVAVNRAWELFAADNGGTAEGTGVGVNYLHVCERAAAAGSDDAVSVLSTIQSVLAGDSVEGEFEYPCPAPAGTRWFILRATPLAGPDPGVLISHQNISRRKLAEEMLQRRASQDPLTGLANRAMFTEELTLALSDRRGRPVGADVGLLYIDLDAFKPVNDIYGHASGDEVLATVSRRLRRLTRGDETVARLGGDEFAVLAPRIDAAALAQLRERISGVLASPHRIHGHLVSVGASVGAHLAAPGEDAAKALHRADVAMYAVKRAGARPELAAEAAFSR